ncbi:MAG TPA: hypothetical protein VKY85_15755 [Candidatus Angelobacter sp.]|jgi:hypothetical protein|nr:hypothetical protein [Candidatus Angelobacter sp.]
MTHLDDNRVLCRRGARELTVDETEFVVAAGAVNTLVCTVPFPGIITGTHTGPGDGDACGDTDSDHA